MMKPQGLSPDSEPVDAMAPDQEQASPEEQAEYERFVSNGILLLFDERMMPKWIAQMKKIKDPREALATIAHAIFMRIDEAAKESGRQIPGDVKFAAGEEIFEHVAAFATKAGIHDFENDQEAFDGAWYRALDKARQTSGDQASAQEDLQMMAEADKAGNLNQMLGADVSQAMPSPQADKMKGQ